LRNKIFVQVIDEKKNVLCNVFGVLHFIFVTLKQLNLSSLGDKK